MRRILLLGTTGQLGQELHQLLPTLGTVLGWGRQQLDLCQPQQIASRVLAVQPDLIINAAAYTAVDRAETEVDQANLVNAIAPAVLATTAKSLGIPLIHCSTNYVFDGNTTTPYCEGDRPHPINTYGRSKLTGELQIQQIWERHLILRTAWLYGSSNHPNFVQTILRLAAEQDELQVVADQFGTPTATIDLAHAIHHLVVHLFSSADFPFGTYHITNQGKASWYDFAAAIVEAAKSHQIPLRTRLIVPITTADYPTPARRPACGLLATDKLATTFGLHLPDWRSSLQQRVGEER